MSNYTEEELDSVFDSPPPYPFQEFWDHLQALETVQKYQHVTLSNGDDVELAPVSGLESMVPRVMDYMRQLYTDDREIFFKGSRLMIMVSNAASMLPALDNAGLAVIGSTESGSLVQERVWRALHHFYIEKGAENPTDKEIIEFASTLSDTADGNEN